MSRNITIGSGAGSGVYGNDNTVIGSNAYTTNVGTVSNSSCIGSGSSVFTSYQISLGSNTAPSVPLNLISNITGSGLYNPTTNTGDLVVFPASTLNNGKVMNLTAWSSTGTGVRIAQDRVNITYGDGSIGRTYDAQSMSHVDIINEYVGGGLNGGIETTSYDLNLSAYNTATIGANAIAFCMLKIIKGITYNGVVVFNVGGNVNARVCLYERGGTNSLLLAQRAAAQFVGAGLTYIGFDAPYTAPTTRAVYAGISPSANMLVPFNANTFTNFGNAATANSLNLTCCICTSTNVFNSPFTGTLTATLGRYYIGLY